MENPTRKCIDPKCLYSLLDRASVLFKSMSMNEITYQNLTSIASLFRVVGHPSRLQIISLLEENPKCVCEIASDLGLNKSVTSKHLAQLKKVGVIDMKKSGTQVMCSISMPCIITMIECAINPQKRVNTALPISLCRKGCE
ncbi:MAG: ArsR family transcriptional regulator [Spirochaetia bacterium]|nr:ArsR family transcriptional regulator [Spirochaetia bacterium]